MCLSDSFHWLNEMILSMISRWGVLYMWRIDRVYVYSRKEMKSCGCVNGAVI